MGKVGLEKGHAEYEGKPRLDQPVCLIAHKVFCGRTDLCDL